MNGLTRSQLTKFITLVLILIELIVYGSATADLSLSYSPSDSYNDGKKKLSKMHQLKLSQNLIHGHVRTF